MRIFERLARFRGADSIRFDHIGHRTEWRSYAQLEAAGFELVREVDLPVLRENYLLQFRKR